jgi:CRP-like cAMP-binding protein
MKSTAPLLIPFSEEQIQSLRTQIPQLASLTQLEWEFLVPNLQFAKIPANSFVLAFGEICTQIYFILQGSCQVLIEKAGRTVPIGFILENHYFTAPRSLLTGQPSSLALQTYDDSIILSVQKSFIDSIPHNHPKAREFFLSVAMQSAIELEDQLEFFACRNAEEKYVWLLEKRPQLLNRFPQHQIAAMLAISPVSLSRIRARIAKKPRSKY